MGGREDAYGGGGGGYKVGVRRVVRRGGGGLGLREWSDARDGLYVVVGFKKWDAHSVGITHWVVGLIIWNVILSVDIVKGKGDGFLNDTERLNGREVRSKLFCVDF